MINPMNNIRPKAAMNMVSLRNLSGIFSTGGGKLSTAGPSS